MGTATQGENGESKVIVIAPATETPASTATAATLLPPPRYLGLVARDMASRDRESAPVGELLQQRRVIIVVVIWSSSNSNHRSAAVLP